MLRKKAFRRIFITTIIFFIVFVVLSIKKLEGPTNIYESNNYKTDFLENIYTTCVKSAYTPAAIESIKIARGQINFNERG